MTTTLTHHLKKILMRDRLVHDAVNETHSDAVGSELNPDLNRITPGDISTSKKGLLKALNLSILNVIVVMSVLSMISTGCRKLQDEFLNQLPGKVIKPVHYMQTNLVSDTFFLTSLPLSC